MLHSSGVTSSIACKCPWAKHWCPNCFGACTGCIYSKGILSLCLEQIFVILRFLKFKFYLKRNKYYCNLHTIDEMLTFWGSSLNSQIENKMHSTRDTFDLKQLGHLVSNHSEAQKTCWVWKSSHPLRPFLFFYLCEYVRAFYWLCEARQQIEANVLHSCIYLCV